MSLTATYAPDLSRVRLTFTAAPADADHALVERTMDGITWTTVRGGLTVALSSGTGKLDDYEFAAGELNTYRASYVDAGAVGGPKVLVRDMATISPAPSSVWVKNPSRPSQNIAVTVTGISDVTRPARTGVFDVVGRTLPIAVTDVQGSRRLTLTITTADLGAAADMDARLSTGEPVFVQAPGPRCAVPTLYAVLGDVKQSRPARRSVRRYFELPLVEVAAPGPIVTGDTILWTDVPATWATWTDVLGAKTSWSNLVDSVSAGQVIVP